MSKSKYKTYFCVSCNREAKMEVLGAIEGMGTKNWYRCTRCRHSMMVDSGSKTTDASILKITRETCTSYSPERIYSVGECIYHTDWDDMGTVTKKEKTSSGAHAIIVAFEKIGERRLIENLPAEV